MRRALLPLLILACVVIAASLAWFTLNRARLPATAKEAASATTSETRAVAPFRRIDVGGIADVTLVQGDAESIDLEVPPGSSIVDAVVRGDTLRVEVRRRRPSFGWPFGSGTKHPSPHITIHFRSLDAIELSGAVKLDAPTLRADALRIAASGGSSLRIDRLEATRLRVAGSGALDARIAGRVVEEKVAISGAGDYRADRLLAEHAEVEVSGVGQVVLRAEKTLRATISGAGSIEYLGDPKVTEEVSGIGRVRRRAGDSSTQNETRPGERGAAPAAIGGIAAIAAARETGDTGQCSAAGSPLPVSLNSTRNPVVASTSACTPGWTRTSAIRQSASSDIRMAATSRTVSYG